MDVKNIINISREIYKHLGDFESEYIFKERLLFSMTGDLSHIKNIIGTIEEGKWFIDLIESNKALYIWGAGTWGKEIVQVWPDVWRGIFDNDSQKWGMSFENIPILNPKDIITESFNGKIFISSRLYYKDIYAQLISFGVPEENIINVGKVLDKLAEKQYFSLRELVCGENEVFADVGSLDAMTAERFIKWSNNKFKKVYCFEPDINNIPKCEKTLHVYIDEGRAEIISKGAWATAGKLPFSSQGNGTSSFSDNKADTMQDFVEVTALDDVFKDKEVSFIKMDIEGAEYKALEGCQKLIQTQKPKLAICIYHKLEDIVNIPNIILQYNSGYKFYLRHYSVAAAETVLYAI